MTFKKFILQIILPVSFILSVIFVPIGLNINHEVANLSTGFITTGEERLVNEIPQTTFDEPEEFLNKFYVVNSEGEYRNVTNQVYIYSILIYALFIFILLSVVYYVFYRIKKIKKV